MISVHENADKTGFVFTGNFNASDIVLGKSYDKSVTCSDFTSDNCSTKITQINNLASNASFDMDIKFMNAANIVYRTDTASILSVTIWRDWM